MRTKGNALIDKVTSSITEIDRLMCISYMEDDYSNLIKNLGGEVEKYLKSVVFQGTKNNRNFNDLINELSVIGLQQQEIGYLHTFGKMYNSYKHDPNYSTSIEESREVLEQLNIAIIEINKLGIGDVNQPYQAQSKRSVWLAGWDDYIGGMTEVSIFIPDKSHDFPTAIEHFNIDISGWYPVINKYISAGKLEMKDEYIPNNILQIWKNESDFLGAGRYTGDIAEIVKDFSVYINKSKEKELLPFLKRKNDFSSVKSAIVFSLFDTLRDNKWSNFSDLLDEIKLRASYDYGVDVDSDYAQGILAHLNEYNITNNRERMKNVCDIIWTDLIGFERFTSKVNLCEKAHIAFDSVDKLIVKLG